LILSVFGRYVYETSGNEANIIIWYYLLPIAIPLKAKYVTLNGHFALNSAFAQVKNTSRTIAWIFENNCFDVFMSKAQQTCFWSTGKDCVSTVK